MVPHLVLALLVGFAVSQLAILASTVYLHRSLAHKAVTFRRGINVAWRSLIWITVGVKPREWVAVHRRHHAHVDTPQDPHSPAQLGWLRVQLTNAALYRRAARDGVTVDRYAKDLAPDRFDRALFDHPFLGLGIGIGLLIVVLGPVWGLVAAAFHTVSYLMLSGAVNAVGHRFGRRPFDNSATNSHWLAWITAGEGHHNNHHALPTSARLGLRRRDIDFGWMTISALRRLGWARIRLERVTTGPTPAKSAA